MKELSFGRMIIGWVKPKYVEDNLPQCQFVHDNFNMNNTGDEHRLQVTCWQISITSCFSKGKRK
jgi:hypothetical protein